MDDPLDLQSPKYYCVVNGCNSSNNDLDSISFFPCPKDPARCQQWKEILGFVGTHQFASLTPQESFNRLRICSVHFDKSSFSMSGKFLVSDAVPSKALVTKFYDNTGEEVLIKTETFWETEHLEDPLVEDASVKYDVSSPPLESEYNQTGNIQHFVTNNQQKSISCYRESVDSRTSGSSNSKTPTICNSPLQPGGARKVLPEIAKSSANLDMPVKKRLRFKDEDDIALLREVAGQNPFANPEVWDIIRQNVFMLTGKEFSLKTLKDHLSLLIKLWLEKKKSSKDISGLALLHYTDKDQLCQDIFDMMWIFKGKDKKKTATKLIESAGKTFRGPWANHVQVKRIENEVAKEAITESEPELIEVSLDHEYCSQLVKDKIQNEMNINDNSSDSSPFATASSSREEQCPEKTKVLCPVASRKRKCTMQDNRIRIRLKQKDQALEAKRIALEERKLDIEEKKLQLQEKKLAMEELERKKYLDILEQQRQDIRKMVERQDKIIETLLLRNGKKTF